ncbi:MAG TPA: amidase, partial [Thermoanaerobaculia bacterium]|nr:amidase [Thermoanaerobaculia bacterium]
MTAPELDRRRFVTLFSAALGVSATVPALFAAEGGDLTAAVIAEAEKVTGLEFTEPEREMMKKGLEDLRESYRKIRQVPLANAVPPAQRFDPAPPEIRSLGSPGKAPAGRSAPVPAAVPEKLEDLAFWPITRLAPLLREGKVRSVDLTRMYLARLRRIDPVLHAVITFTEERALEEAGRADREIAAGRYRGPLHGIPWGAKDLLAARGYPTTWGSPVFKEQVFDQDATVVERLEKAGAVLIAKTSLGELARGDVWFGGMTRNPWNLEQGSSGSSAGSASATVAGGIAFGIGSETLGSIVSPSTRNGATGLRPTFGRVSRHGAMTLCWSLDKLGPLARSAEDCALIFEAIHGPDGKDATVVDRPFVWNPGLDVKKLRVGYAKALFEQKPAEGQEEWHDLDLAA